MNKDNAVLQKLTVDVEHDEKKSPGFHDYRGKLEWVLERAKHYSEKTGLAQEAIIAAWEKRRDYWYMNYYQDSNQPLIEEGAVRVFETTEELIASIGKSGFRCPSCSDVSTSPYACDSGKKIKGKECDWKVYGLFGHMGKGLSVFVKENMAMEKLFMPIAWESTYVQTDESASTEEKAALIPKTLPGGCETKGGV